jgi:hypothetical protein
VVVGQRQAEASHTATPERSRRHPRIGAVPSTRVSGGLARDKLHARAVSQAAETVREEIGGGWRCGSQESVNQRGIAEGDHLPNPPAGKR